MIRNQRIAFCVIFGLIAAAVAALQGVWNYRLAINQARQRFHAEMPPLAAAIAGQLAGHVVDLPSDLDRANQTRMLDEIVQNDPRIVFAQLIDQFQKISAEAEIDGDIEIQLPTNKPLELSLDKIVTSETPTILDVDGEYYQPIFMAEDVLWGQVRLVWDQRPLHNELRTIVRRTVGVTIGVFIFTVILTFIMYGRLILVNLERLADSIDRIVSGGMRGRLEPTIMPVDLFSLITQLNRVLEAHEHDRKRVLLLEDSLRQAESSYHDYKSRVTQASEAMEREKTMALLAFHELFSNTADGIVVCDHNGEVAAANRSARRWLGLRESQGETVSDRSLLSVVQRLTREGGSENSECTWTYRDPIDGQARQSRVFASLLERQDGGRGVVMLHLLPERGRRGSSGAAEVLQTRFMNEVFAPALSAIVQHDPTNPLAVPHVDWVRLDLWAARLRRLVEIEAAVGNGRDESLVPTRFDLGSWLSKQLQASDLFADRLAVRLYPPELATMVAVPTRMMELALDGLIAFLHETPNAAKNALRMLQTQPAGAPDIEWVIRLQRDTQNRAELVIQPTGDFKPSALSHLNILREIMDSIRPSPSTYSNRLTCFQEIALVSFLTAQSAIGSVVRVDPGDRKSPPVVHWIFPHPEHIQSPPSPARRIRPKTKGVESLIERFFNR